MEPRHAHLHGGLVLWKPAGIGSRHALDRLEERLGVRALGHAGTLDPLASGILLVLAGEARKFQRHLMHGAKLYRARVAFGIESESGDGEGPLRCRVPRAAQPERAAIERALDGFRGEVLQVPPRLSALRTGGERAHRRARRGEEFSLAPRRVRVDSIDIVSWEPPIATLEVRCGAGFYVRALARDLGEAVGCGAFLCGLRREALAGFAECDAVALDAVRVDSWLALERLLVPLPRVEVDRETGTRLARGQHVRVAAPCAGSVVVWCEGRVAGAAEARGGVLQPERWCVDATTRS